MANSFELEVATPERELVKEQVLRAEIPAANGYIGVLPDHAPLFAKLGIGSLSYVTTGDRCFTLAVNEGFIEVNDNHVRVLADEAEPGSEIDITEAEKELRHAQEQMANPSQGIDVATSLRDYRNAQARVNAARECINNAHRVKG